jgi:preprotein translocase subunit SecA
VAPAGALAMAAAAGGAPAEAGMAAEAGYEEPMLPAPVEQRRVDHEHQLGRNDPCWCGSGKKFKKCHGA